MKNFKSGLENDPFKSGTKDPKLIYSHFRKLRAELVQPAVNPQRNDCTDVPVCRHVPPRGLHHNINYPIQYLYGSLGRYHDCEIESGREHRGENSQWSGAFLAVIPVNHTLERAMETH